MATSPNRTTRTLEELWHLVHIGVLDDEGKRLPWTGSGVMVAVVDSGIDVSHEQLQERVWESFEFNDDGDIMPPRGWGPTGDADIKGGHGTKVAGLLCGNETGVAPGIKIISVVFPRSGSTPAKRLKRRATAMKKVLEFLAGLPGIRIVNLSAGVNRLEVDDIMLAQYESFIESMVEREIVPVVAVGNREGNVTEPKAPGCCRLVISVGATTREGKLASFSLAKTYDGAGHPYSVPTILAPGEEVMTCARGGGVVQGRGTSFAAPLVAGAAALLFEISPEMTYDECRARIIETAAEVDGSKLLLRVDRACSATK
jgi:subtilisin family serine protease